MIPEKAFGGNTEVTEISAELQRVNFRKDAGSACPFSFSV